MHKAEQERLTRTTETHYTKVVGIDREVIDADTETSTKSDIQDDQIRKLWFQISRKFPVPSFDVFETSKKPNSKIRKFIDSAFDRTTK